MTEIMEPIYRTSAEMSREEATALQITGLIREFTAKCQEALSADTSRRISILLVAREKRLAIRRVVDGYAELKYGLFDPEARGNFRSCLTSVETVYRSVAKLLGELAE